MKKLRIFIRKILNIVGSKIIPTKWKEYNELKYWLKRKKSEGVLKNDHYEFFYTTHFGIKKEFYKDKVILDLGCGPRGSLEWATESKRRIGVDPLADEYLRLGASQHEMEYISCGSENIPLEDKICDAVFSFNSFDHVADINKTASEIKRLLKTNGIFLLIVELNHPPTSCEPHKISPQLISNLFEPELTCVEFKVYKPVVNSIYQSIKKNETIANPKVTNEIGYLTAKFIKN